MACRDRGLGSGTRKPAAVKAARRAVAKGWRGGDEGVGRAWREEESVGARWVWRPERVVTNACGCGGGGGDGDGGGAASVGSVEEATESGLRGFHVTTGGTEAAASIPGMSRFWR